MLKEICIHQLENNLFRLKFLLTKQKNKIKEIKLKLK